MEFARVRLFATVDALPSEPALEFRTEELTRRYDRARHSLDRHATYSMAAYVA